MNVQQKVTVQLFGKRSIMLDKEEVVFPFKQAEALFYYLSVENKVDKSKIADILWGDKCTEKTIQSNIRNVIYVIRKIFRKEIFITANKNYLELNNDMCNIIGFDFDEENLLYQGDFLDGFYIKDNVFFNDWVLRTREYYRQSFCEKLKKQLDISFNSKNYKKSITICEKLIEIDEFEEKAYEYLIKSYDFIGEHKKAINVYNKLEKLLSEELFEDPKKEISDLIDRVKKDRKEGLSKLTKLSENISDNISDTYFFGRENEKKILFDAFESFLENKTDKVQSIILSGEEGVGKTYLASNFAREIAYNFDINVVTVYCYKAHSRYFLKPFEAVMQHLSTYKEFAELDKTLLDNVKAIFPFISSKGYIANIDDDFASMQSIVVENSIIDFLQKISNNKKLVLYFDDIQWADKNTLTLIQSILLSKKSMNVMIIMTMRNDIKTPNSHHIINMKKNNIVKTIDILGFSFDETNQMAKEILPNYKFTKELQKQLYEETEGNAFYVVEMLNNIEKKGSLTDITSNIMTVLENRISIFSDNTKKIIELLSLFYDGVTFETLCKVSKKDEYELWETIDELLDNKILKEEIYLDKVILKFSHPKIREFVNKKMSLSKKRFLHEKIALIYESNLKNDGYDVILYPKLMYHFSKSENQSGYIKYAIKYIYNYLNTEHEFFPILSGSKILFNESKIDFETTLSDITKMLNANVEIFTNDDAMIICDYYHMMARKNIKKGCYDEGLTYINLLQGKLNLLDEQIKRDYIIKYNRQLACIYINCYNYNELDALIKESMSLFTPNHDDTEELCVWKRLEGLCNIMKGDISQGKANLNYAIDCFEKSANRDKYLFNLAASYSWIGEAYRIEKDYENAIYYCEKAINIYVDKNIAGGISVFYLYLGKVYTELEDYNNALIYFEKSIKYYQQNDLLWLRAVAYAYYAYILAKSKMYTKACDYLKKAELYAEKIGGKYEKGIVLWAKYLIKYNIKDNKDIMGVFDGVLDESLEYYENATKEYLNETPSEFELEQLSETYIKLN